MRVCKNCTQSKESAHLVQELAVAKHETADANQLETAGTEIAITKDLPDLCIDEGEEMRRYRGPNAAWSAMQDGASSGRQAQVRVMPVDRPDRLKLQLGILLNAQAHKPEVSKEVRPRESRFSYLRGMRRPG